MPRMPQLLLSQSERCRKILAELAHHPEEDGGSPYTRLADLGSGRGGAEPHRDQGVRLILATAGEPAGEEPLVRRSPEIMHGLNNLVQNAVQFAPARGQHHDLLGQGDRHGRDRR